LNDFSPENLEQEEERENNEQVRETRSGRNWKRKQK